MFPSSATMAIGIAVTAVLAVVDWYVWRSAPRLPHPRVTSAAHDAAERPPADFKEVA